jgi:hypothetical protein
MRQSKTKPTTTQTNERPALSVVVRWREGEGAERVETTTLHGATPRSATLTLEGQPELGQVLCLLLPSAARRTARGEESENLNRLWALVWAVSRAAGRERGDEPRPALNHVSVVFLGGEAPASHDERRAALYAYLAEEDGRFRLQQGNGDSDAAPSDNGQRRDSRLRLPIEVTVELLNEDGSTAARERTVTENISRRGACVWTMFGVERGGFVRVTCEQQNVSLISVVRARRVGDDGIGRLHLEFVNGEWPIGPNG